VDKQGSWYLAGSTESDTVLATNGAHQTQKHGNMDGFITRFCDSLAAITVQPADQKVTDGNKATFTVQVNGSYTYQWQVDDGTGFIDLANGGKYSGVTTSNLTINPVSLNQSGERYRCIIHEGTCRETSADAALLITVGINDINSASIHLHPNPVEEAVTVSLTDGVRYLEVLNMQGQRIVAQHYDSRPTSVTLDISQLPAAIYIVKVNNAYVKRLVKL
ncbi:MAG TPA: T9SS type A sorting domain-containing protein, partial [Flavipsychrobacter sp.]